MSLTAVVADVRSAVRQQKKPPPPPPPPPQARWQSGPCVNACTVCLDCKQCTVEQLPSIKAMPKVAPVRLLNKLLNCRVPCVQRIMHRWHRRSPRIMENLDYFQARVILCDRNSIYLFIYYNLGYSSNLALQAVSRRSFTFCLYLSNPSCCIVSVNLDSTWLRWLLNSLRLLNFKPVIKLKFACLFLFYFF